MSQSIRRLLLKPLAVLVGGVLMLSVGCNGEENIPLKKVDFVLDVPKDFKETRKAFVAGKNSSGRIGRDPSGVAK
jgi:hypothetical protein